MKSHSEGKVRLDEKVKAKQDAVLKAQQKQMAQLVQCVSIASSSPEGIIAFRQIMLMCDYNKSVLALNPQTGRVNTEGTIYNVGRENLWKELRQLIPVKTRKKIEYEKTVFLKEDEL